MRIVCHSSRYFPGETNARASVLRMSKAIKAIVSAENAQILQSATDTTKSQRYLLDCRVESVAERVESFG
jgi:hypothetical protein